MAAGKAYKFSRAQDQFIIDHCMTTPMKRLEKLMGVDEGIVKRRIKKLGIVIPREVVEKFIRDSRIKKGNVPINKGKAQTSYMSAEAIEKTCATRFKKGQIPPNKLHYKDGDITIRKGSEKRGSIEHKFIRLSSRTWKELQIYNWEKVNGPVPKGHVLTCIDGDTLNCEPDNWKLLSRADNARRNSGTTSLPDSLVAFYITGKNGMHLKEEILQNKDLIDLKRTHIQLKRKMKEKILESHAV